MLKTEIKCTINVIHLNHSKTISPSLVHGKIVLHEISPWAKKVAKHCEVKTSTYEFEEDTVQPITYTH